MATKLGMIRLVLPCMSLCCVSLSVKADVLDNWTTNQIATNYFGFHHVVYGKGIYVAVGDYSDSGGFYTSTDGLHWALQYTEPNSWGVSLNYSSGRFCSVAPRNGFNAVDISADGTNWTTSIFVSIAPDFTPAAITYGNGLYVVVGSTNSVASIMTSPDGVTWTYCQASATPGGPINSVVYLPSLGINLGVFVAIGNNDGDLYYSHSGTYWFQESIPGGSLISSANGLLIVPLTSKTNLLSNNGVNWNLNATGLTNSLGTVSYSHGLYMAQCGIFNSESYLATSTDGKNWVQYSNQLPGSPNLDVAVASDGFRLVTGSSTPTHLPPYFYGYNSFVYVSDPLVSVRQTNGIPGKIVISGLVGRNYQIQSADALTAGSVWSTNVTIQLTNTPFIWTDSVTTNPMRFYRGVLLP